MEDLDGLEWCMWVHNPEADRCKAIWVEQLLHVGPDARKVIDAKLYVRLGVLYMGPHISKEVQGITYHLPLARDPHATPLHN